jgi:hypothetical protein
MGWVALGIGFLVPVAAAVAYFASRDALQPFLEAAFLFNVSYGGKVDLLRAFISGIKHLGFAAGAGLAGMLLALEGLRTQFKTRDIDPLLLWLGIDFVLEIILSGLSGLNYPHYFISWLPWVAFACALLIGRVAGWLEGWFERYAVPVVVGVLALLTLAAWSTLSTYGAAVRELAASPEAAQRIEQIPAYVNEHTQPGESVLVWGGGAGINFLARRDSPTAHFQYGILVPSDVTERIAAEFIQQVRADPPRLIVDEAGEELPPLSTQNPLQWLAVRGLPGTPYMQEFFDFVHANYSYSTSVTGVDIYVLEQ